MECCLQPIHPCHPCRPRCRVLSSHLSVRLSVSLSILSELGVEGQTKISLHTIPQAAALWMNPSVTVQQRRRYENQFSFNAVVLN